MQENNISFLKDPDILAKLIRADPLLKRVFDEVADDAFDGVFVEKSAFCIFIGAIIGQVIRYSAAKMMRKYLYEQIGTHFSPQQFIAVSNNLTRLPPDKRKLMKVCAQFVIDEELDLYKPDDIRRLGEINGIGPWTVNVVLLMTMSDLDIFPVGDAFLRNKMKKLYGWSTVNQKMMKLAATKWSPYASIVTWYLWRWF